MSMRATILAAIAMAASVLGGLGGASLAAQTREQVWLVAHNAERAEFGVQPLRWSRALERDARAWAEVLARDEQMRHSSYEARKGAGENLWMGTSGYYRAEQMIAHFAAEKRYFAPGRFPAVSHTGNLERCGALHPDRVG